MSEPKKEKFSIVCDDMNQLNEIRAFYNVSQRVMTFQSWKQQNAAKGTEKPIDVETWGGFGGAFNIDQQKDTENEK